MASISRVPGAKGQEDTLNILHFLKTAIDIDMRIEAVLLQTLSGIAEKANIIADRVKSASEVTKKDKVFSLHQSSLNVTLLNFSKSLVCSAHAFNYSLLTNLPTTRIFTYVSRTSP
jgi:hypothetical protein